MPRPKTPKLTLPQKTAMAGLTTDFLSAVEISIVLGLPNAITTSRPLKQLVKLGIAISEKRDYTVDTYARGPLWEQTARELGIIRSDKPPGRQAAEDKLWARVDTTLAGYSRMTEEQLTAIAERMQ